MLLEKTMIVGQKIHKVTKVYIDALIRLLSRRESIVKILVVRLKINQNCNG